MNECMFLQFCLRKRNVCFATNENDQKNVCISNRSILERRMHVSFEETFAKRKYKLT